MKTTISEYISKLSLADKIDFLDANFNNDQKIYKEIIMRADKDLMNRLELLMDEVLNDTVEETDFQD